MNAINPYMVRQNMLLKSEESELNMKMIWSQSQPLDSTQPNWNCL